MCAVWRPRERSQTDRLAVSGARDLT